MASGGGHVDPESIPREKFGSGDPHTQTAEDQQGIVTGCDEMKAGEEPPSGMVDLVKDVVHQQEQASSSGREQDGSETRSAAIRSGGDAGSEARPGGSGQSTPQQRSAPSQCGGAVPDGSAADCQGHGSDDM